MISGRIGLATRQPGFVLFSILWNFNFRSLKGFKVRYKVLVVYLTRVNFKARAFWVKVGLEVALVSFGLQRQPRAQGHPVKVEC